MKCKKCGEVKLSKEFPPFKLTDDCQHPPLHCLRCVISYCEENKACSQCNIPVEEPCLNLRKCYAQVESLFPEITYDFDDGDAADTSGTGGTLTITRLNGESFDTPFNPSMTVYSLKQIIAESTMKVPPEKQNLLYNQKQLKEFKDDHSALATLGDHEVRSNTTIHLMVLLYAVPAHLNKVVFDLYWGYPYTGRDYLDACADVFKGQEWLGFVDYRKRQVAGGSVNHSGDIMDDFNRQGHHIIKVTLQKVPSDVTHIFFTLCTWKSPTISRYPNPSMKFYEESNPGHLLCTEKISKGGNRQAIIMCSLMRSGGQWLVHSNGTPSDGNNRKYEPILDTIQKLIRRTGNYPYVPFEVTYGGHSGR